LSDNVAADNQRQAAFSLVLFDTFRWRLAVGGWRLAVGGWRFSDFS